MRNYCSGSGFTKLLVLTILLLPVTTVLADGNVISRRLQELADTQRQAMAQKYGCPVRSINMMIATEHNRYFVSSADPGYETTAGTYFRFASNTKTFTGASVLLLEQMGLLNIDDKIVSPMPGSDIPYIPDSQPWNIPYKDQITIRQLLGHTAGIFDVDNTPLPDQETPYIYQVLISDPDHQFTADELVGVLSEYQRSSFPPGTDYSYSNTGCTILGEIVARVYSRYTGTAKTLTDFLNEQFIGPDRLNLTTLHFPNVGTDKTLPEPSCIGYCFDGEEIIEAGPLNVCANVAEGNGYGTLDDLTTWVRSLMTGKTQLNRMQVKKMKTDVSEFSSSYALLCMHSAKLGYGHTGAFSSGFMSLMFYDPEDRVSVVLYTPLINISDDYTHLNLEMNDLEEIGSQAKKIVNAYPDFYPQCWPWFLLVVTGGLKMGSLLKG